MLYPEYPGRIPSITEEALAQIPELEPQEIQALRDYDTYLTRGVLHHKDKPENNAHFFYIDRKPVICRTIEAIYRDESLTYNKYRIFPQYLNQPSTQSLIQTLMMKSGISVSLSPEEVTDWFLECNPEDFSKQPELLNIYKNIATETFNLYKKQVAECIAPALKVDFTAEIYEQLVEIDPNALNKTLVANLTQPPIIKQIRNIEGAQARLEELRTLKQFYKQEYRALSEEIGPKTELNIAKQCVIDFHVERLNQMINTLLPVVNDDLTVKQLSMLDKHEFGIGEHKVEGNFTQVSDLIETLIEQQRGKKQAALDKQIQKRKTHDEQSETTSVSYTADDAATIVQEFLQSINLFSQATYDSTLSGAHEKTAEGENMWIIHRSKRNGMAIDPLLRVVHIPLEFADVKDAKKAFTVAIHELEHVLQRIATDKLGLAILEEVGGGRRTISTEGGAMYMQNIAGETIDSEEMVLNTAYYEAAKSRLAGNNAIITTLMCAAEMLRSDIAEGVNVMKDDQIDISKLIQYTNKGYRIFSGTDEYADSNHLLNSGVLNYLEQEAYTNQIPPEDLDVIHFTGINYRHYQIFKKLGLINLNQQNIIRMDKPRIMQLWKNFLNRKGEAA